MAIFPSTGEAVQQGLWNTVLRQNSPFHSQFWPEASDQN